MNSNKELDASLNAHKDWMPRITRTPNRCLDEHIPWALQNILPAFITIGSNLQFIPGIVMSINFSLTNSPNSPILQPRQFES